MALDCTSPSYDCTWLCHTSQTQGPRAREKVGSTAEVSKFRTPAVQMSKQLPQSHRRVMYMTGLDLATSSLWRHLQKAKTYKTCQFLSCTWRHVPVAFLFFWELSTCLDNVMNCKSLGHLSYTTFFFVGYISMSPWKVLNDETLRGWSPA